LLLGLKNIALVYRFDYGLTSLIMFLKLQKMVFRVVLENEKKKKCHESRCSSRRRHESPLPASYRIFSHHSLYISYMFWLTNAVDALFQWSLLQ